MRVRGMYTHLPALTNSGKIMGVLINVEQVHKSNGIQDR